MKTVKKIKNLLTIGDAKTIKGEKLGFKTAILYMSPYKQNATGKNLCAHATPGCAAACLFTAGRGKFSNVKQARINKSNYFLSNRSEFILQLFDEINFLGKKHSNLVIRLNGTTDIPYENITVKDGKNIFELFPNLQFYDYTKDFKRIIRNDIPNYNLTFSMAETAANKLQSFDLLRSGYNVAAVFNKDLYNDLLNKNVTTLQGKGCKVNLVDGDVSDLRFLDKKGSLVMLKAKGDANKDRSGFVINSIDEILDNL
jgi:hypothetical protein